MDTRDNGTSALKARVLSPLAPAPRAASRPRRPMSDVVLYELHVKGFTMTLPGIPDALRGTYAGLAHPVAIAHLQRLGVTTLSLLPVQTALHESGLDERGLANYWGYNTIGFFCPDARYAACRKAGDATIGSVVEEFRAMVATLQSAGFEVVLDVVYNHTPEGDENGPTILFRGLDNPSWYRLMGDDAAATRTAAAAAITLRVIHPARDPVRARFAALLGRDDGRGRLPLRSGAGSRPYASWFRSFRTVLGRTASRPDAGERASDRRALGLWTRRLPTRPPARPLQRMERSLSRRRTQLLARQRCASR